MSEAINSCRFCSAEALQILVYIRAMRRWEARLPCSPRTRPHYCTRCATALMAGESGEALARRLNQEYAERLDRDT